ncbi:hypothetical protein AAMO2058_000754800 [Amorphochlora amoebiformis]
MCCCCGMRAAHIASLVLIIVGLIFAASALSGTGEQTPWGRYTVEKKADGATCTSEFNFGLEKYGGEFCAQFFTSFIKLDIDEEKYSSSNCGITSDEFCDPCDRTGKSVEAMLALAIVSSLLATGAVVWRLQKTLLGDEEEAPIVGCSIAKCAGVTTTVSCVMWVAIGIGVWFECQQKINDQMEKEYDATTGVTDKHGRGTIAGGYWLATVAWILFTIAAGNQCCSFAKRVPGGQAHPAGVVTATAVAPPPAAPVVAVAEPIQAQYAPPAQPYGAQPVSSI